MCTRAVSARAQHAVSRRHRDAYVAYQRTSRRALVSRLSSWRNLASLLTDDYARDGEADTERRAWPSRDLRPGDRSGALGPQGVSSARRRLFGRGGSTGPALLRDEYGIAVFAWKAWLYQCPTAIGNMDAGHGRAAVSPDRSSPVSTRWSVPGGNGPTMWD